MIIIISMLCSFIAIYMIFSGQNVRRKRLILSIPLILMISLLGVQKDFGSSLSDDFLTYFENYIAIFNGHYERIYEFGYGGYSEFGLTIVHYLIGCAFSTQSPYVLMYVHALIITIMYYAWVELYACRQVNENNSDLMVFFCFLFYGASVANQLTRQVYSSIFILYALSFTGYRYIFLIAATVFHFTAPFIYLVFKLTNTLFAHKLKTLSLIIAILLVSDPIYLLLKDKFYINKFFDYYALQGGYYEFNFSTIKSIALAFLVSIAYKMRRVATVSTNETADSMANLTIIVFVSAILLGCLPYASIRLFLPFYIFLMGFVIFLLLNSSKISKIYIQLFALILLAAKLTIVNMSL